MGFAVPVHPEQSQNVADCLAFRGPETFLRICSASTVDEVPCIGRADRLSVEIKQVEKKVDEGIDVARIGRGLDHAERGVPSGRTPHNSPSRYACAAAPMPT